MCWARRALKARSSSAVKLTVVEVLRLWLPLTQPFSLAILSLSLVSFCTLMLEVVVVAVVVVVTGDEAE